MERESRARNINLSDSDLARLLSQGQPGNITGAANNPARLMVQGQPGNVTGGRAGLPGILGMLTSQSSSPEAALAKQRQMERDSFGLAPANASPVAGGQNQVQLIMAQLQKLLTQGPGGGTGFSPMSLPTFDPNRYKKQAETAVSSQFDPIIEQIMAQQKATQGRAATNKQAVAGLYQGAVNDINTGAAQTQKDYDQTQAQSKQLYTDERNRIAAAYAADAAAQRAQAKKLGTEALGVDQAIAQQTADKNFADQMGSQQMQSSQAALGQQEAAAAQYDKSIAQATGAEGIEAQGDIMRQLEDYMSQSNSDLANTRSQAAGSVNDLMMKLAQAAYDRDAANTQFQYGQQRDYIGDQKDLYQMQRQALMDQLEAAQNASGSSSTDKLNPWQSVALFADQLRPGQGSDIVAAIQGAMSQRQEISGINPTDASGNPIKMNPALFAQLIADSDAAKGMDRNTVMQVSQELYRLLYGT
jgi:hypothetical protein